MLSLFVEKDRITAPQVAAELALSERMARNLLKGWMDDGWLEVADPPGGGGLTRYRQFIGNTSAAHRQQLREEGIMIFEGFRDGLVQSLTST
ncbi:MAG: hypothetical protein M0Q13_15600 [Methanothrix sp.]|jgi:hypothetical protein|nr:hypothetical protein [Methanothrix sp.]